MVDPMTDSTGQETLPAPIAEASLAPLEASSMGLLLRLAITQKVPADTLERLLDIDSKLRAARAREAFLDSMSAFQAECPSIKKTREVRNRDQSLRYRYAALEDIQREIRPLLAKHGLSTRFQVSYEAQPPAVVVTCIVTHVLGHSESSEFRSAIEPGVGMTNVQASGSAQSYGKRYALVNALDLPLEGEDNDGRLTGRSDYRGVRSAADTGNPYADPVASSSRPAASATPVAGQPRGRNMVTIRSAMRASDSDQAVPSEIHHAAQDGPAETPASASTRAAREQLRAQEEREEANELRDVCVAFAAAIEGREHPNDDNYSMDSANLREAAEKRCDRWLGATSVTKPWSVTLKDARASHLTALKAVLNHTLNRMNAGVA